MRLSRDAAATRVYIRLLLATTRLHSAFILKYVPLINYLSNVGFSSFKKAGIGLYEECCDCLRF